MKCLIMYLKIYDLHNNIMTGCRRKLLYQRDLQEIETLQSFSPIQKSLAMGYVTTVEKEVRNDN